MPVLAIILVLHSFGFWSGIALRIEPLIAKGIAVDGRRSLYSFGLWSGVALRIEPLIAKGIAVDSGRSLYSLRL